MKTLHIAVKDRIATYKKRDGVIVCGNNDYELSFTFDEEWDIHPTKTARFIWNDRYYDQEIINNKCKVPSITNTTEVMVGVYAGDIWTTTAAKIHCKLSILCGSPEISDSGVGAYRDEAQKAVKEAKIAVQNAQDAVVEAEKALANAEVAVQDAQNAAAEARRAASSVIHPTIGVAELTDKTGYELTINDADGTKKAIIKHGQEGKLSEKDAKAITDAKEAAEKAASQAKSIADGVQVAVENAQKAAEEARNAASTVVSPTINTEAIPGGYKLTITDANHTESIEIKNGEGGLTAQQLIDFNNMLSWYKLQNYKPMTGTFKTAVGSNTAGDYAMRTSNNFFDVVFEYSFDKKPNEVAFSIDETKNGVTETTHTETLAIPEANTTLSKTVKVGSEEAAKYVYKIYGEYYDTDTKKTDKVEIPLTFEFCNYLYYGYAPALAEVTSDTVKNLIPKLTPKLTKSRSHSFKSACPIDQYIWVAYPTRLKKASFQMGIFEGGFGNPATVDVTNQFGATESYYVYRSVEIGFSDDDVHVK